MPVLWLSFEIIGQVFFLQEKAVTLLNILAMKYYPDEWMADRKIASNTKEQNIT